jgi:hypothetical protein
MGKLCKLLDGRIMHVWSINEEDETVDVFPNSEYDIEVDVPETIKDHLVLLVDSSDAVLNMAIPISFKDYRSDLAFQIGTIDDLDWDYFLVTTEKAKASAVREGLAFNQIDGAAFNIEDINEVDEYRKQIKHELEKPVELDWDRFEGLVIEARNVAISHDENMTFDRAVS